MLLKFLVLCQRTSTFYEKNNSIAIQKLTNRFRFFLSPPSLACCFNCSLLATRFKNSSRQLECFTCSILTLILFGITLSLLNKEYLIKRRFHWTQKQTRGPWVLTSTWVHCKAVKIQVVLIRMKNIIVLMFIIYEQQYDKTKGPLLQH